MNWSQKSPRLKKEKKNKQGTNSEGKETRTQSNDLEQKEEIKIQPEQNGETRIQKNEADFSKETLQARRGWKEVFEVMKGKDLHPRLSSKALI